jgi:hypothetical protein
MTNASSPWTHPRRHRLGDSDRGRARIHVGEPVAALVGLAPRI